MQKLQEMVLYYQAGQNEEKGDKEKENREKGNKEKENREKENKDREKAVRLMKSVLVRMGVRIKNIGPDQVLEKVGYLAGIEGYGPRALEEQEGDWGQAGLPVLSRDVLVMKNFTSSRIDVLLAGLRKAGVPKIKLKAVVTPQNADWSFYALYQELVKEHEQMAGKG